MPDCAGLAERMMRQCLSVLGRREIQTQDLPPGCSRVQTGVKAAAKCGYWRVLAGTGERAGGAWCKGSSSAANRQLAGQALLATALDASSDDPGAGQGFGVRRVHFQVVDDSVVDRLRLSG